MIQVLQRGEVLTHKAFSLHKRIDWSQGPPTYWLTITMPWKRAVYDLNTDSMVVRSPRYSFGFRFWGPF